MLFEARMEARREYFKAVAELLSNVGSDKPTFERLLHVVDDARVHSEQATVDYENHVTAHECFGSSNEPYH